MADLIDSYSESNQDTTADLYSGSWEAFGQAFACSADKVLDTCKFYLKKTLTPTGLMRARIYSHTGTYGSGTPDATLATSDDVDVSVLTTSLALVTFTFSGAQRISLTNGTKYYAVLLYSGAPGVQFGYDSSSASHGGNMARYLAGWNMAGAGNDGCFYVYGVDAPAASGNLSAPTYYYYL